MTTEIRDEIARSGPLPFDRFVELALYGGDGFYTRPGGGSAGRRGDFITSPEVGPLFGAVIGRYLDAEWRRLGRPERFTVVEVGAGPGTLARTVAVAEPDCADALEYVAVEISDSQRAAHPAGIVSAASLPDGPITGVVIANELLDNLPFRLAVFDGGWREAHVDATSDGGPDGRFVEVLSTPLDPVPSCLPANAAIGARAPLVDRAAHFVADARRLLAAGTVLCIDYGVGRTAELAARPWRQWMRTYRDNARGAHYLADAGLQDITIDVPLDQLPPPDTVRTQAQFLQLHGITDLVEEGKRVWAEQAARPNVAALRMRSRVSESEALLDPHGLGGFLAVEWRR